MIVSGGYEKAMQNISIFRYYTVESDFGEIVVVWRCVDNKVVRVFLPTQYGLFRSSVYRSSGVKEIPNRIARILCRKIGSLLRGKPVDFALDNLDWSLTYRFQKRVLRMEHRIPRGSVSTYGRIGKRLGNPGAARAVGTALARNPFPLIIPCHRAVRSDGSLGGYAGGIEMKKRLLEFEGIGFDKHGRVVVKRFW
jgi:methylated-DNA-[protein]-cysteine S-methyltransferase